jgi:hypothetical protein
MDFGKWMQVEIPAERLFKLESNCRGLAEHGTVGKLAAQLLRQNYRQQEMLQAAVHEIARLELMILNQNQSA